jgi:hypothetical protein
MYLDQLAVRIAARFRRHGGRQQRLGLGQVVSREILSRQCPLQGNILRVESCELFQSLDRGPPACGSIRLLFCRQLGEQVVRLTTR